MELARLLAPRDPALQRLAREIHASRQDLQQALPLDSLSFCQWLGTYGLLEYPELGRFFPPLPPESLRATICGGLAMGLHLRTGAEDLAMLAELWQTFSERPFDSIGSVLDFGCGCGRVLRWFQTALPNAHLHGADVRAVSIDWCRQNLRGTFVTNDLLPPLPFADRSLDLVYALSVWSHLGREQNLAWLREIARVTKPDGLIMVSTHGAFAAALCARSPEHQAMLQSDPEEARTILRAIGRESFVHRVLPQAIRDSADGVADDYGQAFFTERFVREHWADCTEYLGCVPCALNLYQDMFVLRPRVR